MNFHGWKLSTLCLILILAHKSLFTLCGTEARSHSYQTFVCNSFYLINARSLSLFLLPPSFFPHFSVHVLFRLPFSSSFAKSEYSDLRGLLAWGRGWTRALLAPGFAGAGRWSNLCFASFSPTEIFNLRLRFRILLNSSGGKPCGQSSSGPNKSLPNKLKSIAALW